MSRRSRCTRRTAAQAYSGQADWSAIARLKEAVTSIPVLGNGDIWSAEDALAMVRADRLRRRRRRPRLPGPAVAVRRPRGGLRRVAGERVQPGLREVTATLRRHAEYLVDFYDGDEGRACRDIRKHIAWYLKGFPAGSTVRTPARPSSTPAGARRPDRHDGPRRAVARRGGRGPARAGRVAAGRRPARELAALARARRGPARPRWPRPSSASPAAEPGPAAIEGSEKPGSWHRFLRPFSTPARGCG